MLLPDAQAKSAAPAANGTASKAKAGKVVFGNTGNRLLDKQQAKGAAKAPVPEPEVGCCSWKRSFASSVAKSSARERAQCTILLGHTDCNS